jgi:hypothetical protein
MLIQLSQCRSVELLQKSKLILLILSLVAACITVVTFYGWTFLWGWDSPLFYSAELIIAALGLQSSKLLCRLLTVALSLYLVIHLSYDMYLEWHEYWVAGDSIQDAILQSLYPVWEPIHVALAVTILFVSAAHLNPHRFAPHIR